MNLELNLRKRQKVETSLHFECTLTRKKKRKCTKFYKQPEIPIKNVVLIVLYF